jgi:NADH-quinone oxidoreductase subunit G
VQAAFKKKTVLKSSFVKVPQTAPVEEKYNAADVAAYAPDAAEVLVVPLHSIFGSEEQSAWAPGIAVLSGRATIVFNPADAERLSIRLNDTIEVSNNAPLCRCSAQCAAWVTPGSAALSFGRAETQGINMPQRLRIRKVSDA